MKCRYLIAIIVILLLVPFIHADKKLKATEKKSEGSTVSFNETDYTLIVGNTESIGLKNGENIITLHLSDCLDAGIDEICFEEKTSNTTVILKRYDLSANIIYKFGANTSQFISGEERKFNISINNSGGSAATDVVFRQTFSDGAVIDGVYGCSSTNNSIYWRGTLLIDDTRNCKYTVKLPRIMSSKIYTELNYTNFDEEQKVDIEDETISSYIPFQYNVTIIGGNLTLGQNFTLQLNMSLNDSRYNFTIDRVKILNPEKILRVNKKQSDMMLSDSELVKSKRLKFNKTDIDAEAQFILLSEFSDIKLEFLYTIDDEREEYRHTDSIPLNISDKDMIINISYENVVTPGQDSEITITAINPNPLINYTSIRISIDSKIKFSEDEYRLKNRNTIKIPYKAPYPNGSQTFPVTLKMEYFDQFKQKYKKSYPLNITVMKMGELNIRKYIVYQDSDNGRIAVLKVDLQNNVGLNLTNISIFESLTNSTKFLNISDGKSLNVLKIPITYNESENLKIFNQSETIVKYSIGKTTFSKKSDIDLNWDSIQSQIKPKTNQSKGSDNQSISNQTEGQLPENSGNSSSYRYILIIIGAAVILAILAILITLKIKHRKKAEEKTTTQGENANQETAQQEGLKQTSDEADTQAHEAGKEKTEDKKEIKKEKKKGKKAKGEEKEAEHTTSLADINSLSGIQNRLSELEDEMTEILKKVEDHPKMIQEASKKEEEYNALKKRFDELNSS